MKIPKQLKIGGLVYKIIWQDEPIIVEGKGDKAHGGMIDFTHGEITLQSGMSPDYTSLILLHEIIHGIFEHMGVNTAVDDEEAIVNKMANGLHGVLKDNNLTF